MSVVIHSYHTFFLALGCLASLAFILLCIKQYLANKQKFFPKRVITAFEKRMFIRLKQAFPQHHVLAQVAFSALITSDDYKIRRLFNRKVTDFVLLNDQLEAIVIIELDDPTHMNKAEEDQQRDLMLQQAGYRVLRYTDIPSIRQLKQDVF